ncbi:Ger(x)C family spore germination protein [Robertmurraya sp. FSL R5-0851]|uniref:Ger(x)C family spore germination protein n=1 Tax=Robertmurraya sp. FSL R5-0851 TaxID=2921584 RepID=UPI0030F9800E
MKIKHALSIWGCVVMLAGCWDRIELNDVSIVTGLAVDEGKNSKYRLTIEIVNAAQFSKNQMGGQATPALTYSLEGNSVSELLHKMNIGMTRRLIFSHTRVLYISEEIAKKGILEFIDYLDRSGQFRNDFNIMVTKGEKAEEFAKVTYPTQKVPSLKIHRQTQSFNEEWGGDPGVRLTDFISALTSKGRNPVSATLVLTGDPKKGASSENNMKTEMDALVEMDGMAVFRDDRLVGYLSVDETRNYYWTQKLKKTSMSIPCSGEEKKPEDERYIAVTVTETHNKLKVDFENGKPVLKVIINGETRIEATQCMNDLTKIGTYEDFEKKINRYVANDIKETIKKVQTEFGVDIFGFGEALNRQHHKEYKKVEDHWDEVFAQADVEVDTNLHLRRSGVRGKTFITEIPRE